MGMWSRIRKTFRGDRHTAEIQEELQFHLQMDAAQGHDAREARMRLGHVARIEEETRAVGIVEWLDSAMQDARYGLRQLRKAPALVTAVVLSLAIGVGANTAGGWTPAGPVRRHSARVERLPPDAPPNR